MSIYLKSKSLIRLHSPEMEDPDEFLDAIFDRASNMALDQSAESVWPKDSGGEFAASFHRLLQPDD